MAIIPIIIKAVSSVGGGLGEALGSIKGFASGVKDVLGSIATGFKWTAGIIAGIGSALAYFVKGFMDADKAAFRLKQTLITIGDSSGYSVESVKALKKEVMGISAVSSEQLDEIFNVLIRGGNVKSDELKKYTERILDLGYATGDMNSALRMFDRYTSNAIDALNLLDKQTYRLTKEDDLYIERLKRTGDLTSAQIFLNEKLAFSVGANVRYAETLGGKWDRLKNSFSDLREEIGKQVSAALKLPEVFDRLKKSVDKFTNSDALKKWIDTNLPIVDKFLKMVEAVAESLADPQNVELEIKAKDATKAFTDELSNAIGRFFDMMNSALGQHGAFFVSMGGLIGQGMLEGIKTTLKKLPETIVQAFHTAYSKVKEDAVNSLKDANNWLLNKIGISGKDSKIKKSWDAVSKLFPSKNVDTMGAVFPEMKTASRLKDVWNFFNGLKTNKTAKAILDKPAPDDYSNIAIAKGLLVNKPGPLDEPGALTARLDAIANAPADALKSLYNNIGKKPEPISSEVSEGLSRKITASHQSLMKEFKFLNSSTDSSSLGIAKGMMTDMAINPVATSTAIIVDAINATTAAVEGLKAK